MLLITGAAGVKRTPHRESTQPEVRGARISQYHWPVSASNRLAG
jgi:hypothetical protein